MSVLFNIEIADSVGDDLEYQKCLDLWRAVVERAFSDAQYINPIPGPIVREEPTRRDRMAAMVERSESRTWLLEGGRNFRLVCAMAGLDPATVMRSAAKIINGT